MGSDNGATMRASHERAEMDAWAETSPAHLRTRVYKQKRRLSPMVFVKFAVVVALFVVAAKYGTVVLSHFTG